MNDEQQPKLVGSYNAANSAIIRKSADQIFACLAAAYAVSDRFILPEYEEILTRLIDACDSMPVGYACKSFAAEIYAQYDVEPPLSDEEKYRKDQRIVNFRYVMGLVRTEEEADLLVDEAINLALHGGLSLDDAINYVDLINRSALLYRDLPNSTRNLGSVLAAAAAPASKATMTLTVGRGMTVKIDTNAERNKRRK